jgi:hypothetical protein
MHGKCTAGIETSYYEQDCQTDQILAGNVQAEVDARIT